jgi:pimeloyl-ACP methyl ester carboxylesterase
MQTDVAISLIPGAAGLAAFWEPISALLPRGLDQQSFDLPGFGSAPDAEDVSSYPSLVEHLAQKIRRPSVVAGQSMGGYVALQLALRHPEKVTHLVLTVAAAGVDMARHGARDWRPAHRLSHPNAQTWVYDPTVDLGPELHRIRVPVLLIWAERDPLSPLGAAHELCRALPDARLVTFDTDDHWVARRFARETAAAIASLVAPE